MAYIVPTDSWDNNEVYQIETTDPVQGGAGGLSNYQGQALANSNKYLYNRLLEAQQRLPIGSVMGCVLRGESNATTGEYNYMNADTAGGGASFTAGISASGSEKFTAVFQNGRDANGCAVFHIAELSADLTGAAVDFGSGTYYAIAVYDEGTDAITDVMAVRSIVVSPVQPTFATAEHIWVNDRTLTAKYWDGSTFADIICTPIGVFKVTKLGTYTVDYEKSLTPYELFFNPAIPAASILESAGYFDSNIVPPFGGYLQASGQVVAINQYPRLYAKIGTSYNTGGEGAGNFRLPDYRGIFRRGLDDGRGLDTGRTISTTLQDTTVTAGAVSVVPNLAVIVYIKY